VLADLVRTDRHQHRPIAGDSELAQAVKVLARTHQNVIWARQRQTNTLRSTLREFYPAALTAFDDLASRDALAVLAKAPTPERGAALRVTQIEAVIPRRQPPTQHPHAGAGDQHRAPHRAADRDAARGAGVRGHRVRARRGHHRAGTPDRDRRGGARGVF